MINDHILFMVPTIHGKGVIVAPMLDGHVLVGPSAEEGIAKEDTRLITMEKFEEVATIAKKIIPGLRTERTCLFLAVLVRSAWKLMTFGLPLRVKINGLSMLLVSPRQVYHRRRQLLRKQLR